MKPSLCPPYAPVLGYMGVVLCMGLGTMGSSIGTYTSGASLLTTSIPGNAQKSLMRNLLPVVMSGVLGVYCLVVGVIIAGSISPPEPLTGHTTYSIYSGFAHLSAGICCGLCCLAAGKCIGMIGNVGTRAVNFHLSSVDVKRTVVSMMFRGRRIGRKTYGSVSQTTEEEGEESAAFPTTGLFDVAEESICEKKAGQLYVGVVVMLIFSEALALYGLITAVIISQKTYTCDD